MGRSAVFLPFCVSIMGEGDNAHLCIMSGIKVGYSSHGTYRRSSVSANVS